MTRPVRERGSALLLATIVVLMTLGIGGAFLVEFLIRGKVQAGAARADEALVMCDATLEKARRALHQYRFQDRWNWNDILEYSSKATTSSLEEIKADYLARAASPQFSAYLGSITGSPAGLNTANEAPLPADPKNPSPNDGGVAGVLIGWNTPYANGAVHVLVRDNADDPEASPLVDGDRKVVLVITATLRDGTQRRIEATILYSVQPLAMIGHAAIQTNSDTSFLGNISVDGRDHDLNGVLLPGAAGRGVLGVLSSGGIAAGGSAGIGGNGLPPPGGGVAPGSVDPNHSFPSGYPTPDDSVGGRSGTLKSLAQASGTYFTSQAQYNNYLALNGGNVPGGKVIYLEASTSPPFDLGNVMNDKPSILVVHNSTSTATLKNLHGEFKGVLFADAIDHVNAGTDILGMIQTSSDLPFGNAFGNGNSTVKFSSAVLQNLPSLDPGACPVLDWKKVLQ